MSLSKEETEQVTDWYDNEFWPAYPGDLTRNKHGKRDNKGSKAYGLQCCLKLTNISSHQERKRILANLKAQVRYDRQDPDCTRWPMVSSYLNQKRFDDVIESTSDLKERTELAKCRRCDNLVHGPKFDVCADHLYEEHDPWRERRIESLKAMGLMPRQGEDRHEWAMRCKSYLLSTLLKDGSISGMVMTDAESE